MNLFPWLPFLTGITITKETNCAETGEQLQGNKVVILQKEYPLGTSGLVYQEKTASTVRKVTILFCVPENCFMEREICKTKFVASCSFFWELFHPHSAHPSPRTTNNGTLPSPMGCFTSIIKTVIRDASSCHIVWTTCQPSGQVCLFKWMRERDSLKWRSEWGSGVCLFSSSERHTGRYRDRESAKIFSEAGKLLYLSTVVLNWNTHCTLCHLESTNTKQRKKETTKLQKQSWLT